MRGSGVGALIAWWVVWNLIVSCFAMYVAAVKNRSVMTWGVLTFVFNIVALIALAGVPALDEERHHLDTEPDPGIGWQDQMTTTPGERNA